MKNYLSKLKHYSSKGAVALSIGLVSTGAFAETTADGNFIKPLLDSVDIAPIKSGILSAGGVMLGLTIVVMVVRKIRSMFSS